MLGITLGGVVWNLIYCCLFPPLCRVEHRLADGATNPYLSLASILAAGLDGVENNIGNYLHKHGGTSLLCIYFLKDQSNLRKIVLVMVKKKWGNISIVTNIPFSDKHFNIYHDIMMK